MTAFVDPANPAYADAHVLAGRSLVLQTRRHTD
jgi:hypothetical protein